MADNSNKRIIDRRDGRLLRSIPAFSRIAPFLLRRRSECCSVLSDSVEVTDIEHWLREKRGEGWAGLGFLHLLVAAYVRTVSMRPGINRFVAGGQIYARNDISVVLTVKRSLSVSGTEAAVKVSFSPNDTVFDVYRRISSAVDEIKADVAVSEPERLAAVLMRLPRFALRVVLWFFRFLDYRDWLPRSFVDASPFHASMTLTDLGSLGIVAAEPPLPDFGTVPVAVCFGAKRKVREGDASEYRYVDYRITVDGRIADAYYFSSALKCLKYFLKNPRYLELPPESIEDDIN